MEKAREFQKNTYFSFIDCAKAFDCADHNKLCRGGQSAVMYQALAEAGRVDLGL